MKESYRQIVKKGLVDMTPWCVKDSGGHLF